MHTKSIYQRLTVLITIVVTTALFFIVRSEATIPANAQGSLPIHQESEVVSGGGNHTCAINSGGGVECWGYNNYGQLGNGTITNSLTVVDVVDLSSSIVVVSAGDSHTCAVTSSGSAKCWGLNISGQLGYGSTTNYRTPVDVVGLDINVSAIEAGGRHTCALTHSGGVQCWGYNGYGQIGDGTQTNALAPVNVSGLTIGVAAISAGTYHTCAITSSGGVKCWGHNGSGQLGDGTTTQSSTPVDVSGLNSGVIAISAGSYHTCALTSTGGIKCWGNNVSGQIGDGTISTNRLTPVDVAGSSSGMSSVSAGGNHTCATTTLGRTKCWGFGPIGNGSNSSSATPVDVMNLSSGSVTVTLGESHSCALMTNGIVKCWGNNNYGTLGDGTSSYRTTPVDVLYLTAKVPGGGNPTPTPTPMPRAYYDITGRVTNPAGLPLEGVYVYLDGTYSTFTNNDGSYTLPNIPEGEYFVHVSDSRYDFDQARWLISLYRDTSGVDFIGVTQENYLSLPSLGPIPLPSSNPLPTNSTPDSSKIPIVIVHGIQFGSGYECSQKDGPYLYKELLQRGDPGAVGDLPRWFYEEGDYEVWIAYLDSTFVHTPTFQENANCLLEQIKHVRERTSGPNGSKMIVVAHSMGGLVTRACLAFRDCNRHIDTLVTLGSPHAGVNADTLTLGLTVFTLNSGLLQLSSASMALFNDWYPLTQNTRRFIFIGGDVTPYKTGWIVRSTEGPNDGITGRQSAVGRLPYLGTQAPSGWMDHNNPITYWTSNVHTSDMNGISYYGSSQDSPSEAYECIMYELGRRGDIRPSVCRRPTSVQAAGSEADSPQLSAFSMQLTGIITQGQIITRQLQIDSTNYALFSLSWVSGDLDWTLAAPDGTIWTPSTANVKYNKSPGSTESMPTSSYLISPTEPGLWQLGIKANKIEGGFTTYSAFAAMETNNQVSLMLNETQYNVGEKAIFTATVDSSVPITDVIMEARILLPNGAIKQVEFVEQSDNTYSANYEIPDISGYSQLILNVTGLSGETPFSHRKSAVWITLPHEANLNGVENYNQDSDNIVFDVNLSVSQPSTYTVIVHVSDINANLVTVGSTTAMLTSGAHRISVPVGVDQFLDTANTNYSVSKVILLETSKSALQLDELNNAFDFVLNPISVSSPSLISPADNITIEEGSKLTYQWQSVANATSYEILQLFNPGGELTNGNRVTVTGTTYSDELGHIPGLYSWEVTAKTEGGLTSAANRRYFSVAPHNPGNLQVTATGCQTTTLTWQDNSAYETAYYAYRNGAKINEQAALNGGSGQYQDSGLAEKTVYEYKVVAHHPAASLAGVTISVETPSCPVALQYTLSTLSSGNGSVTISKPGPYTSGTQIQLTAVPDSGWHFVHWESTESLGDQANLATITVMVSKDATYTAYFEQNTETLDNSIYLPLISR